MEQDEALGRRLDEKRHEDVERHDSRRLFGLVLWGVVAVSLFLMLFFSGLSMQLGGEQGARVGRQWRNVVFVICGISAVALIASPLVGRWARTRWDHIDPTTLRFVVGVVTLVALWISFLWAVRAGA